MSHISIEFVKEQSSVSGACVSQSSFYGYCEYCHNFDICLNYATIMIIAMINDIHRLLMMSPFNYNSL